LLTVDWLWDALVDADLVKCPILTNTTLGWQWIAGCGADDTPFFHIFKRFSTQITNQNVSMAAVMNR
jgi:deoxyribodipyrimidine photolyase